MTWKQAIGDIGQRHPGQDKKEWREAIKKSMKVQAELIKKAVTEMSPQQKAAYNYAMKDCSSGRSRSRISRQEVE